MDSRVQAHDEYIALLIQHGGGDIMVAQLVCLYTGRDKWHMDNIIHKRVWPPNPDASPQYYEGMQKGLGCSDEVKLRLIELAMQIHAS